MAKIIEMNFGGSQERSIETEQEHEMLDLEHLTEVFEMITPILGHMDPHQRTVNTDSRREIVGVREDNDLISAINGVTQELIKEHPTYYAAIIDELIARGIIKRQQ